MEKVASGATLRRVWLWPWFLRSLDASCLTSRVWVVSWTTWVLAMYLAWWCSAVPSVELYVPVLTSAE